MDEQLAQDSSAEPMKSRSMPFAITNACTISLVEVQSAGRTVRLEQTSVELCASLKVKSVGA